MKVISYENAKKGVYKYSIIHKEGKEIEELQRFIKTKNIDLDIKVEIRDITIPEKRMVGPSTKSEKDNEILVVLQGPDNGVIIFCDYPIIEHNASSLLNWIINWKRYDVNKITEISFYTKGLTETLEIKPYAWGCDDSIAFLSVDET